MARGHRLELGTVFDGCYRIDGVLGEGGFATVYAALDQRSGEEVALKVLKPTVGQQELADRARFEREVRALTTLKSPSIVRLLGHGESAGLPYAAFERVPGRDLGAHLHDVGTLSPREVLTILVQILEALQEAHAAGVIHRDIKPANIMLVDQTKSRVKLLDFGIARAEDDGHPSVTRTGEMIGTPRYMSPEQLMNHPLGPPSDIYSLGLVGIELLVGSGALAGASLGEQLTRMLPKHEFDVGPTDGLGRLATVLRRMTAREPGARYQSASAVLAALTGRHAEAVSDADGSRRMVGALVLVGVVIFIGVLWQVISPPPPVETVALPSRRSVDTLIRNANNTPEPARSPVVPSVSADTGPPDAGATRPFVAPPDATPSPGCGRPAEVVDNKIDGTLIHLPVGYDSNTPYPMVVALHADFAGPEELLRAGFADLSDDEGVIVLLPTFGRRGVSLGAANVWRQEADAMEFLREVQLKARGGACVDESRIFVAMTGDGARMRRMLACADWVRAIGHNSFMPDEDERPRCDRPVAAIWIFPRDSPGVPLDGTPTPVDHKVKFTLSALESQWVTLNGCHGEPHESSNPLCRAWACDAPFEVCVVPGGEGWVRSGWNSFRGEKPGRFPRARVMWRFFQEASGLPIAATESQ